MQHSAQQNLAKAFLETHTNLPILRLANAWDTASAKVFERSGYIAIGITSSGIAASWGYPDGENISFLEMLMVVNRIASTISAPLSVDPESGYSSTVKDVLRSVEQIIETGAVEIYLEDVNRSGEKSIVELPLQIEKIAAIREMANSKGIHLVINARTDIFLHSQDSKSKQFSEVIKRGNAYRESGADCIFVVGTGGLSKVEIGGLVREIDAPINIFVCPSRPPIKELEEIGVARVSFGGQPIRSSLAKLRLIAQNLITTGDLEHMFTDTLSEEDVNAWFS